MSNAELRERAAALGVAVTFRDWQGNETRVPDETLARIVSVLDEGASGDTPPPGGRGVAPRPAGPGQPSGLPRPADPGRTSGPAAPVPVRRAWGFTLQLYSLRSRGSWGHGDLRDLADLAVWSARDLGADFVVINPLHAAEPLPPVSASPYLPMSRRWISPLYLRVEDIPEFEALDCPERTTLSALAAPLLAASSSAALIDRDAVWTAKLAALEAVRKVPLSPARQAALDQFRARGGQALTDWATWCAIAESQGPDYRQWPRWLRHPRSPETAALRGKRAERVAFHTWLQWLAAEQVAAAQRAAREAGMTIGIVHDLAVGEHPGGADAWAWQNLIAGGFSVGAPPDEFNQRGQDWTLPPWHPGRLAASGFRPLAELVGALAGAGGGLRIDHVMGLSRLWWVPEGKPASEGAYVYYDIDGTLGTLAEKASAHGAVVIGEDLGTVESWLRDCLGDRGVLGTSMLWFERGRDGAPLPPHAWRRNCLATVSTHDMPPAAAFLTGEQVTERARLGLLTRAEDTERAEAAKATDAWLAALVREGLLPAGERPALLADGGTTFTAALYGYLAKTPALLVGVSLAEAAGERRSQNMPGTTTEYPNWRLPLCGHDGTPVLLEDLPAHPGVRAVAESVCGRIGLEEK